MLHQQIEIMRRHTPNEQRKKKKKQIRKDDKQRSILESTAAHISFFDKEWMRFYTIETITAKDTKGVMVWCPLSLLENLNYAAVAWTLLWATHSFCVSICFFLLSILIWTSSSSRAIFFRSVGQHLPQSIYGAHEGHTKKKREPKMPFVWTNWGWTSDINEVVLLTAWTMKGSQISPISDRRRHQTMTTSPWISPRNSQRRERNSSTTASNKRRKTHTFSQKTGLWECLCHWLSWWPFRSTPDVTADFLSLSLSLTLVLPNSRECAGGRCFSGRGGAFTMRTVREVWRTPLPLPRVSLSVSLWNLWRYFFSNLFGRQCARNQSR